MKFKYFLLPVAIVSVHVFAGDEQCKSNFTKEGSVLSGTTFKTWAEVEGVESIEASQKVYLKTVKDGWKITNYDKKNGIISAAQGGLHSNGKAATLNIIVEKLQNSTPFPHLIAADLPSARTRFTH